MIKKKMSMLLAAVLVASGAAVAAPAKAANVKPTVTYAAPARTMIETDNKMEFVLQASVKDAVEYRVHAQNVETGTWYELTDGYQKSEVGTNTFKPTTVKALPKGSYKASIWVRKVGSEGRYDSYKVTNFKIQAQGYFDSRANMDELGLKDTYKVGEKVTLTGNDQYKLHTFDPSAAVRKDGWMIDDTYEAAKETTYTFEKPGVYLIDVWGKKADSTNKYDGWVLKVVTVTEGEQPEQPDKPVEGVPKFEVTNVDSQKLPFQTLVQIKLDTDKPQNYTVTVGEETLDLKETKDGVKVFTAVLNGTLSLDQVKEQVKVEAVKKEELPKFEVTNVDSQKLPFQTLVQVKLDTDKPENYTVKVGEEALALKETKDGEKVFTAVLNGTLSLDEVTAKVEVAAK